MIPGERQAGRIVFAPGIEQGQVGDLVARGEKLLGHSKATAPPNGCPPRRMGPVRLDLADFQEQPGCHIFDLGGDGLSEALSGYSHPEERLIRVAEPRQIVERQRMPLRSGKREERRS